MPQIQKLESSTSCAGTDSLESFAFLSEANIRRRDSTWVNVFF
jgi:hypothetical protein